MEKEIQDRSGDLLRPPGRPSLVRLARTKISLPLLNLFFSLSGTSLLIDKGEDSRRGRFFAVFVRTEHTQRPFTNTLLVAVG